MVSYILKSLVTNDGMDRYETEISVGDFPYVVYYFLYTFLNFDIPSS